ncbi:DUF3027 domain-containing protein [Leifsonia sp. ZF2019]|uniref:DUF3027 domain-containing protein n=1 Tax=Leifsonia sp. ZF2019 TaxID=2781978 RepID=UPI001CBC9F93|nr:DUF3027 domain-containing protein [Leifsonia sp. ZF2019]UAJ78529.1 DUF3027 domain-containing protein [Leifsonia sp. ZF2019]
MPDTGIEDLLAAEPLARRALAEITPEATIGAAAGHIVEGEAVVSLLFEAKLAGYPGWRWTVTIGRADEDAAPTVLEAELMPAEGALLAPDWVPWSERLADYQAAQEAIAAAEAEAAAEDDSDEDDSDEDDETDDESDEDDADDYDAEDDDEDEDDDHDVHDLHGDDDLDGVDIDSLHGDDAESDHDAESDDDVAVVDALDPAFDEVTDVDADLDLPAEEAAALEEPEIAEAGPESTDQQ